MTLAVLVEERKRHEAILRESEISLHKLTGRLITAQEEERVRIARELHDDISQRMAFLQIGLEQLEQSLAKQLHDLIEVVSEMSTDLHSMSRQLHPAKLDFQGLVPTMASFCREFSNQHELQVTFLHHDVPAQIPKDVALCLFRIVQEALRNIVKHTDSLEAKVELSARGDELDLCISDSSAGFNLESVQRKSETFAHSKV